MPPSRHWCKNCNKTVKGGKWGWQNVQCRFWFDTQLSANDSKNEEKISTVLRVQFYSMINVRRDLQLAWFMLVRKMMCISRNLMLVVNTGLLACVFFYELAFIDINSSNVSGFLRELISFGNCVAVMKYKYTVIWKWERLA